MNNFKQLLINANACKPALIWVGNRTVEEAWVECERGDWLAWSLEKLGWPKTVLVGLGAQFAELVIPIYEKQCLNDTWIRTCIEGCKRFSNGEITKAELEKLCIVAEQAAIDKAYNAAYRAVVNAAEADAARAAIWTADVIAEIYTADAIAVADAACYAAAQGFADDALVDSYAAAGTVEKTTLKQCADIVRIKFPKYPGHFKKEEEVAVSN